MHCSIVLTLLIFLISIFSADDNHITQITEFSILTIQESDIPAKDIRNKTFNSFNKIYDNKNVPFWGQTEKTTYNNPKQIEIFEKIKTCVNEDARIKEILKNAQLIYPNHYNKNNVKKMNQMRVPVYYGYVHTKKDSEHYENVWGEELSKDEISETWQKKTIPAFYSGLFPWYYYTENNNTLHQYPDKLLGIVFSNGVNFETNKTIDFKRYLENNGTRKEKEKINLEKYMQEIADNIVYSGITLTKKIKKTKCYFRMPKIGLRCFCRAFQEPKAVLIKLYLTAYYNALKKYCIDNTDMQIHIDFFEFDGHKDADYKTTYESIFNNQNKPNNLTHNFFSGNIFEGTLGNQTIMQDPDYQTIIPHAGDSHSFLGNGGIYDESLEQKLIGFENDAFLTPAHLLNLFFGKFFKDELDNPRLAETEKQKQYRIAEEKKEEELAAAEKEEQIKIEKRIFYLKIFVSMIILITIYYNKKYIYDNILFPCTQYFNKKISK